MSEILDNWDECSSDDENLISTPLKQISIPLMKTNIDVPAYIKNMKISVVLDDLLENIPKSSVQHVYAGTGTGKNAGGSKKRGSHHRREAPRIRPFDDVVADAA